ncbi:MAG: hypothetical protein ACRES8_09200 [Nevskiaceae bacterium]
MRLLAFFVGMTAVTGACAGEFDAPYRDGDAVTAQLVYETRFGAPAGMPAARSLQLQVANEAQRAGNLAPLRAEYRFDAGRFDSGRFLVNGLDVEQAFIARQGEEGGLAAAWGGWLPLAIVIGAAALIVVDGQDQDAPGTGVSP